MARDGEGGRHDQDAVRRHQEELEPDHERRQASNRHREEAQSSGTHSGKGEAATPVRFVITARRVRIDPARKREDYIRRLEALIEGLDRIINAPDGVEKIQLKAMDTMIKAVRMCYYIVRDVDVEKLEDEFEELERQNKEAKERAGDSELGYEIEEDPAE